MATTSQIGQIDAQLLRAGRLDKRVKIEFPDPKDREAIFGSYLQDIPHELSEEDMKELAQNMNGFSGADIV